MRPVWLSPKHFGQLPILAMLSVMLGHGWVLADRSFMGDSVIDGAAKPCGLRPFDSIWYLNTRELPCQGERIEKSADLHVQRFNQGGDWSDSSLAALINETRGPGLTWVYVHASRVTAEQARERGVALYHDIMSEAPAELPVRMIIWSWPTRKSVRLLRDYRSAAAFSDSHGFRLAEFLSLLDADAKVSLLGFSFGCRVVTGALHVLGGGELLGRSLPLDLGPRHVSAVLWAAAVDKDWLLPGRPHGHAMSRIDRMLLVNNSCDRALRYYKFIWPLTHPHALGTTGLPSAAADSRFDRVEQKDFCDALGSKHSFERHRLSPSVMQHTRRYLLGDDSDAR